MEEKRPTRSQRYQNMFNERIISEAQWHMFNYEKESEEVVIRRHEIIDELMDLIIKNIKNIISLNQRLIFNMYYFDNMTQKDIGDTLGVNQSSIIKSLLGNTEYKPGIKIKRGGSLRKLKRKLLKIERVSELLQELSELNDPIY